jgi:hypothetical protein
MAKAKRRNVVVTLTVSVPEEVSDPRVVRGIRALLAGNGVAKDLDGTDYRISKVGVPAAAPAPGGGEV